VNRPEELDPGTPLTYATTWSDGQEAIGLLVRSNDGRPTHLEGNPMHPGSGGALNSMIQASILDLYDPDRTRSVINDGKESSWDQFLLKWTELYTQYRNSRGEGLAVLSESSNSPTISRLQREFKKNFPKADFVTYAPISDENISSALSDLLGYETEPQYHLGQARTILSLDSDFLALETGNIRNAGGFAEGRKVEKREDQMNRLYVAESTYTVTGSMADHRVQVPVSKVPSFALAIARELDKKGLKIAGLGSLASFESSGFDAKLIEAIAEDLAKNTGRAVVIAGRRQPSAVHQLVWFINLALSANGTLVNYPRNEYRTRSSSAALANLVEKMKAGQVTTLVMLGGNPVYSAPVDLEFSKALKKVTTSIHLGQHNDETSRQTHWHIPATHYLEAWSDAEAHDGTLSVVQPLIAPLFDGHSEVEILSLVATGQFLASYELVRTTWNGLIKSNQFEEEWRRLLHDGVYSPSLGSVSSAIPKIRSDISLAGNWPTNNDDSKIEIQFAVSKMMDGRFTNNGWLMELPDPITKAVWDCGVQVAPALADRLGVAEGEMVDISAGGRTLEAKLFIIPGHVDNCATLQLGYGRKMGGRIADGIGCDSFRLRSMTHPWYISGGGITPTGRNEIVSTTQSHNRMEGRPLLRENTLEGYKKSGEFYPEQTEHPPLIPLWEPHKYEEGNQWGMTVDLNSCIGCGACTVACQSENNIPIVGADQVHRGREMHWIRVDRYFAGDLDDPEVAHQPVMCQQCENAPCEAVCPVAATSHDKEGLNVMVYNRCIGTRYCSNNCPYKVRRFNFYNFTKDTPEVQKMGKNPEVTIRSRGVMEKCTYCVQRISKAKIAAKRDGRSLKDGDVVTACQSVCPTKAINFGNILDQSSKVVKMKKLDRNYSMLEELNTVPRTTYLAKLRNPNPKLVATTAHADEGDH
jgi:molybdopterin-containing oxidoreductase family iron-sulfur binding subunit